MKDFFSAIGVIILICFTIVGGIYGGYELAAFMGPKWEDLRRDIDTHSRATTDANVHELYQAKREYEAATTDAQRQTIRLSALHQFETATNIDNLPVDLQVWYNSIKN